MIHTAKHAKMHHKIVHNVGIIIIVEIYIIVLVHSNIMNLNKKYQKVFVYNVKIDVKIVKSIQIIALNAGAMIQKYSFHNVLVRILDFMKLILVILTILSAYVYIYIYI